MMDCSFIVFLTFFLYASSFSEDSMLNKLTSGGLWSRRQPQMIYVFFTNRDENVTHGNVPFVPTPGVEDIYQRSVFYPNCDKIARLDINQSMLKEWKLFYFTF